MFILQLKSNNDYYNNDDNDDNHNIRLLMTLKSSKLICHKKMMKLAVLVEQYSGKKLYWNLIGSIFFKRHLVNGSPNKKG